MIKFTLFDDINSMEYSDESDSFSLTICIGVELPFLVKVHANEELKIVKEVTEHSSSSVSDLTME